ncbi:hypothetical protein K7Y63_003799 [Serratia marcescens]
MTLTTERQQFEEWFKFHSDEEECTNLLQRNSAGTNYLHPHTDLAWIAWKASRELLANREAQPVAVVISRGHLAYVTDGKLELGTKLYTAPPAPAVPDIKIQKAILWLDGVIQSNPGMKEPVTCRAAMLKGDSK